MGTLFVNTSYLFRTKIYRMSAVCATPVESQSTSRSSKPAPDVIERLLKRLDTSKKSIEVTPSRSMQMLEAFKISCANGIFHNSHETKIWDFPPGNCLDMLDTCCKVPERPKEIVKLCYSIDFGGSHIRLAFVKLLGDGTYDINKRVIDLHGGEFERFEYGAKDANCTASWFFAVVASEVSAHLDEVRPTEPIIAGALTVCFPTTQRRLDEVILKRWAKGWNTGENTNERVVGRDMLALLNQGLANIGETRVRFLASINDTTAGFLTCAYLHPAQELSCFMIVGTGVNGCYVDPVLKPFGYQGDIVNTELGSFSSFIPSCDGDSMMNLKMCQGSPKASFEKRVAGAHLCDTIRFTLIDILHAICPNRMWHKNILDVEECMNLAFSNTPYNTQVFLEKHFKVLFAIDDPVLKVVGDVVEAVVIRSAKLAGMAIVGMIQRSQIVSDHHTIAIDGSLIVKQAQYREIVKNSAESLLLKTIEFVVPEEPTLIGPALAVATLPAHLLNASCEFPRKRSMDF